MCQKCVDYAVSLFGKMTKKEATNLFINATSYPAGSHDDIKKQLNEHYNKGARLPDQAISFATEEIMSSQFSKD